MTFLNLDQEPSFLIPPEPSSGEIVKEVFMDKSKRNLASFLLYIIRSDDYGFEGKFTAVDLTFGTQGFSLLLAPLCERVSDNNVCISA